MEEMEALIETPNIIEDIPAILRSRRPDTSEEIVNIVDPINTPPPIVIDEIVEEAGESTEVEVPASPLPPPMRRHWYSCTRIPEHTLSLSVC